MRQFFLFVVFIFAPFFVSAEEIEDPSNNTKWRQNASAVVTNQLIRFHYLDQDIDDNFSKRVYSLFIKKIDPNKHFLTKEQMVEFGAYEYKVDNDIREGTFNFYDICRLRLREQVTFVSSIYNTLLKDPIDLNAGTYMETDVDKKELS